MASVRAPVLTADPIPVTVSGELPAWVRRLPQALFYATASVLIPGYASRWF